MAKNSTVQRLVSMAISEFEKCGERLVFAVSSPAVSGSYIDAIEAAVGPVSFADITDEVIAELVRPDYNPCKSGILDEVKLHATTLVKMMHHIERVFMHATEKVKDAGPDEPARFMLRKTITMHKNAVVDAFSAVRDAIIFAEKIVRITHGQ